MSFIFSLISCFSGAGGLTLGLHAAGFKHRALYEWDASAVETLRYNQKMGHESLAGCDISRADVRDVDFRKYRGVDLVAGGPPCQPFSMGGKAAGMNDSRDMFPQAIRAVAEVQPRAFIFENVCGLLRPAFSNYVEYIRLQMEFPEFPISENVSWDQNLARLQRHKERAGKVVAGLRYRVHLHQANAADYGVPQHRPPWRVEPWWRRGSCSDLHWQSSADRRAKGAHRPRDIGKRKKTLQALGRASEVH